MLNPISAFFPIPLNVNSFPNESYLVKGIDQELWQNNKHWMLGNGALESVLGSLCSKSAPMAFCYKWATWDEKD